MNIFIDKGNAPPMTGIGNYSDALFESLHKITGAQHSVCPVPISSIGKGFRPLHRLRYMWRLHRFLKTSTTFGDIIHFTNVYVPAKIPGLKYVVTIHDLDPLMIPYAHSLQYSTYFKFILQRSIERADLILTDTEAVRNELIERFGVDRMKVKCLGVGISSEFTSLADLTPSKRPNIPTFLFVGQLNKKKNVRWLIETIHNGIREGKLPKIQLILAGAPGFGFEEIKTSLTKMNTENILWINRPNLKALVGLYRSCTAVIVPSLREGFGIPLLESMYCNCKIIASDIPTNREVAGDAAKYFSLHDRESLIMAVRNAIHEEDNKPGAEAAQAQLKKYQWNELAVQCLSYYQDLSGQK